MPPRATRIAPIPRGVRHTRSSAGHTSVCAGHNLDTPICVFMHVHARIAPARSGAMRPRATRIALPQPSLPADVSDTPGRVLDTPVCVLCTHTEGLTPCLDPIYRQKCQTHPVKC